jgi:hypothetical protein
MFDLHRGLSYDYSRASDFFVRVADLDPVLGSAVLVKSSVLRSFESFSLSDIALRPSVVAMVLRGAAGAIMPGWRVGSAWANGQR